MCDEARGWSLGRDVLYRKIIFATLPFVLSPAGCREKIKRCIKLCRQLRSTFPSVMDAGRVTPHGARGREEKWRVLATSRREKRGRAFLRKVGREGIRLYITRRAHSDHPLGDVAHGRGVVDDAAPPSRRPCLKTRACS